MQQNPPSEYFFFTQTDKGMKTVDEISVIAASLL